MSTYAAMRQALEATGVPAAEFAWNDGESLPDEWMIIAPEGGGALTADSGHAERTVAGSIDYFSRTNGALQARAIEQALEASGVAWGFESIQWEPDTRLIHWEWTFEAVGTWPA